jgi:hypothetical protein
MALVLPSAVLAQGGAPAVEGGAFVPFLPGLVILLPLLGFLANGALAKLVAMLRERKEIGPADIKDLLGISRKYAIPLLEFFDSRRVTARVGERRVLRGA